MLSWLPLRAGAERQSHLAEAVPRAAVTMCSAPAIAIQYMLTHLIARESVHCGCAVWAAPSSFPVACRVGVM